MGTTYMNFSTGVFHVDGDAPLTQAQVDSVWRHLPTTGASWVERGNLFVQQFDGAKAFNLGPVERGIKGVSNKARLGGHAKRHHATKKKSPAQLQREIDEVLRASDREKHGYDTDPISDREFEQSAHFEAKKYGLKHEEALRFVKHPSYLSIRSEVERWREQHGFPAANSSLTRGYLLDKLRVR